MMKHSGVLQSNFYESLLGIRNFVTMNGLNSDSGEKPRS